jgi:hypothetical protein
VRLPVGDRPVVVALAGPNGAGKTTFYHGHLEKSGLRLVNADVLADELGLEPYAAARAADLLRRQLVAARESFVANLTTAIRDLPVVLVYDNENLRRPFRRVAVFDHGRAIFMARRPPAWLIAAIG